MTINCEYDLITSPFFLGDVTHQAVLEARLTLPGTLPRVNQVKGGDFRIDPPSVMVDEGQLMVSGKAYPRLLYLATTTELQSADASDQEDYLLPLEFAFEWEKDAGIEFTEMIEIPGLGPGMYVDVDLKPVSAVFEREGEFEVLFHGKIELTVHSASVHEFKIIKEISPPRRINTQKEQIVIEEMVELRNLSTPVQASLLLPNLKPSLSRILSYQIKPTAISTQSTQEKIILKGYLEYSVVYVGCDDDRRPTEIFVNEWNKETGSAVPFEVVLNHSVSAEQMLIMPKIIFSDVGLAIKTDREIASHLNIESNFTISRIAAKEMMVEALSGPGEIIDSEKYLMNFEEFSGEINGEIPIDAEINLPFGLPGIERILTYQTSIGQMNVEASDSKALIEGQLNLELGYIGEDLENQRYAIAGWDGRNGNGVPIAGILESSTLQPETLLRTQVMPDGIKLAVTGERSLKVTGVLKVSAIAKTPRSMLTLQNCALVEPVDPSTRPCMLFYLVQPGDTLWKIARRYQTTVDSLVKTNQLTSPDHIEIGMKLIIPKRVVGL